VITAREGQGSPEVERLNSRYDQVLIQRGAYFVMLRHMNRDG